MKVLKLSPDFESLLRENGLADFDTLMRGDLGESLDEHGVETTRRVRIGEQDFFLKRRASSPLRISLELYAKLRRAHSAPYREMLHAELIRAAGLPAMRVAAAGEERRLGFPRGGFILTRGAPGQGLQAALPGMDPERRMVAVRALGSLVGGLHGAGFFNSLRLKDVICDWPEDRPEPSLTLIDREVRTTHPRRYTRGRALRSWDRATGRAARYGRVLTPLEWVGLFEAYTEALGGRAPMSAEALAKRYEGRSF
ncbi:MAG: hypothetical protein ACYTGQ_06430 [Planctomycetota bacterium]